MKAHPEAVPICAQYVTDAASGSQRPCRALLLTHTISSSDGRRLVCSTHARRYDLKLDEPVRAQR